MAALRDVEVSTHARSARSTNTCHGTYDVHEGEICMYLHTHLLLLWFIIVLFSPSPS